MFCAQESRAWLPGTRLLAACRRAMELTVMGESKVILYVTSGDVGEPVPLVTMVSIAKSGREVSAVRKLRAPVVAGSYTSRTALVVKLAPSGAV